MKKKEKAEKIKKILSEFFPNPQIPLSHQNSYTLLIAVLLSAQCTDERVNKVTPKLFSLANTPEQMIQLTPDEIEKVIKSCGLSARKAKAIYELSKIIIDRYQGIVPSDLKELESLPGVGHKTASVVMCQAFHIPAFPVDTHIHRCAQRWGLSSGKNVKTTEEDLKKIFAKEDWIELHLQMILFARKFCRAKSHIIEHCPICSWI